MVINHALTNWDDPSSGLLRVYVGDEVHYPVHVGIIS